MLYSIALGIFVYRLSITIIFRKAKTDAISIGKLGFPDVNRNRAAAGIL